MKTPKSQPVLTIGIIFKNEIRCLERCLRSLEKLREIFPCELIMADTGSDDGSRKVAARYADVLFDFPWINDFSAARNAVMDKASGQWYMTIDADEYLDADISELTRFLYSKEAREKEACTVVQRNYDTPEMDERYSDFMAMRLLRMSTGMRYSGDIHEIWHFSSGYHDVGFLSKTILHHDGYVNLNTEQGKIKRERNLSLIRKNLAKDPDNLRYLLQYLESGNCEEDYIETLNHAVDLVKRKCDSWESLGPSVFRYAVQKAKEQERPELDDKIKDAQEWFPDSYFTRIDVEYVTFINSWDKRDYISCIQQGERYLKALSDYQMGRGDLTGLMYGCFYYGTAGCKQTLILYLSDSYIKENLHQKAISLLEKLDYASLLPASTENWLRVLWKLHVGGKVDTSSVLLRFFKEGQKPVPNKASAIKRMNTFYQTSLRLFMHKEESGKETVATVPGCLPYKLFLPLQYECELGLAAMIMDTQDMNKISKLLLRVKDWAKFPIEALAYALEKGLTFPMPEKPLKLEEIDSLIVRLATDKKVFISLLKQINKGNPSQNWQTLTWNRQAVLLAVRTCNWPREEEPSAQDSFYAIGGRIGLARLYARIEETFLSGCYTPEVLCAENLSVLPALHRFGWHFVQAFRNLDTGNSRECVRELRAGLETCKEMNSMVEYLIKHFPQPQMVQNKIDDELLVLAEQIRTVLSAFSPDDPAIVALKASAEYQKVAKLIEE